MGFSVKSTRREAPVRAVFHGAGGVGKSTLAASAPNPIFICAEDGLGNIDTSAVEPYPRTFEEVVAALDYVGTLTHETIVIDSLDWLEPVIWEYVCRIGKKADIEAFGYGKGYVAALHQWRLVLHKLDALREKGMRVIMIAHSIRKPFKNPVGDDYEHWTIKVNEKAAGLIAEWSDIVGLVELDIATEDTSGRVKALSSGKRIVRCNPSPAYLAKTRFTAPAKIAIPREGAWDAFARAIGTTNETDQRKAG